MTSPYFAFLVLAAAYGLIVVVTNLSGEWRRPAVCAAAAVGIAAFLAWRYETAGAGLAAEGAQHWFTIGCLSFETLFIAERTAENHVQHILTKLGLRNRSQIAAWTSGERAAYEYPGQR